MASPPIEQVVAELLESTGAALGLLAAAVARQLDAERLHADLEAGIAVARAMDGALPLAGRLATRALAAVDAERMARRLDGGGQSTH